MEPPRVCESILETVGNTPLVRIRRMNPEPNAVILAKLEGFNPMGSVKERIALRIVEEAERRGELKPGMALLESSSGNTGIGLAMVGSVKGYPVVITMAQKVSVERRQILRALGAEIVFTSKDGGSDEAWDLADRLHADHPGRYFRVGQYVNPDNALAHYEGTAEEIWLQSGGRVDWLVLTLGTCGIGGSARKTRSSTKSSALGSAAARRPRAPSRTSTAARSSKTWSTPPNMAPHAASNARAEWAGCLLSCRGLTNGMLKRRSSSVSTGRA